MSLFFNNMGASGAAFRMRALSERLFLHLGAYLKKHGFEIEPGWLPLIFCLESRESKNIGALALEIGYSHVAIVKIVKAMQAADWVEIFIDPSDRRKKMISLSTAALAQLDDLQGALAKYDAALAEWIKQNPDMPRV